MMSERDMAAQSQPGCDAQERASASAQPSAAFLAILRHAVADYGRTLTTAEVLATLAACIRDVEAEA